MSYFAACPECGYTRSRIIESRKGSFINPMDMGKYRKRKCLKCGEMFYTVEQIEKHIEQNNFLHVESRS